MSQNFNRFRVAVLVAAFFLSGAAVFAVPSAEELLAALDRTQTFDSTFARRP